MAEGANAFRAAGFKPHEELEAARVATTLPKRTLSYSEAMRIIGEVSIESQGWFMRWSSMRGGTPTPSRVVEHVAEETIVRMLKTLGVELGM